MDELLGVEAVAVAAVAAAAVAPKMSGIDQEPSEPTVACPGSASPASTSTRRRTLGPNASSAAMEVGCHWSGAVLVLIHKLDLLGIGLGLVSGAVGLGVL